MAIRVAASMSPQLFGKNHMTIFFYPFFPILISHSGSFPHCLCVQLPGRWGREEGLGRNESEKRGEEKKERTMHQRSTLFLCCPCGLDFSIVDRPTKGDRAEGSLQNQRFTLLCRALGSHSSLLRGIAKGFRAEEKGWLPKVEKALKMDEMFNSSTILTC